MTTAVRGCKPQARHDVAAIPGSALYSKPTEAGTVRFYFALKDETLALALALERLANASLTECQRPNCWIRRSTNACNSCDRPPLARAF